MSMSESAITDLSGGAAPVAVDGLAGLDGGLLDTFGIESPAALEAPLPTDADANAGAEPEKPDVAVTAQPDPADKTIVDEAANVDVQAAPDVAVEGVDLAAVVDKPIEAAVADPELSAEENRLIQALPEADRGEGARRMKAGSFYSNFKNPQNPIAATADELFRQSASRAGELQSEMVARSIADPVGFAKAQYAKDPEAYGKFVSTLVQGDPKYFSREFTGREDMTPAQTREAVEFWERNKDRLTDDQATELTPEELADVDDALPEVSAKIKSILARPTKTAEELKAARAELEQLKGSKEQEQTTAVQAEQQRILTEQKTIEDETYGLIETSLVSELIDAPVDKGGLGLAISDAERTASPEVARLKGVIRGLLLKGGLDDLPGFEHGFSEWGKPQEDWTKAGNDWSHFVNVREKQNATEVAQTRLLPMAKTYFGERVAHPTVKYLMDQLKTLTTKVSQPPPAAEKFITGAAPGAGAKAPQTIEEFLDEFTPARV